MDTFDGGMIVTVAEIIYVSSRTRTLLTCSQFMAKLVMPTRWMFLQQVHVIEYVTNAKIHFVFLRYRAYLCQDSFH